MFFHNPAWKALPAEARARLEILVGRFEDAWRRGQQPRIEDYLPADPRERQAILFELVHADLEHRLAAGDEVRVETYLERYPEVAGDTAAVVELVTEKATLPTSQRPGSGKRRLGKYELLEVLGKGTFGLVYRARDTELDREVAVKVPRHGQLTTEEETERFLREARSTARLRHPGLVALLEAGEADGLCYLVCDLVAGVTLAQRLASGPLAPRRAAELVARVAEALHYAHQQGVVHRDVKPSNILLDGEDRPFLTDFGLAKPDVCSTLTGEGDLLGTPAYMSPEQARGEASQVDARMDVYSLGVVLYETLTGVRPFRSRGPELFRQILEEEPSRPRYLNRQLPADLENICLKALSKDPGGRYATAAALADDLGRYLRGEPVRARPLGWPARLARWCRRRPVPAGLGIALALTVILGLAGTLWLWRSADGQRRRAESALVVAEEERRKVKDSFSQAHRTLSELLDQILEQAWDGPHRRQDVLDRPLAYYRGFLDRHGRDPALKREVATASLTVARILAEQMTEESLILEAYQQAADHWEGLLRDEPESLPVRQELAAIWGRLGAWRLCLEQRTEALACLERARKLIEPLIQGEAATLAVREVAAHVFRTEAIGRLSDPKAREGLACCRQARDLAAGLVRDHPEALDFGCLLAEGWYRLGVVQERSGQKAEGLRSLEESLALWDKLAGQKLTPDRLGSARKGFYATTVILPLEQVKEWYRIHVADFRGRCLIQLGQAYGRRLQLTAAQHSFEEAARSFEFVIGKLTPVTKPQGGARRNLAAAQHHLGNLLREWLRPAEAVIAYRKAQEVRRQLRTDFPREVIHACDLTGTCQRLAQALEMLGQGEEALAALREALETQASVVAQVPEDKQHRHVLAKLYGEVGRRLRARGLRDEAARLALKRQQLFPADPAELYAAACDLAACVSADNQEHAGQAVSMLRQAVEVGFGDLARLKTEPALRPLHSHAGFQQLLSARDKDH